MKNFLSFHFNSKNKFHSLNILFASGMEMKNVWGQCPAHRLPQL